MTLEDLKILIVGDTEASQLMAEKNDFGCAARCSVIAPKLLKETRLSQLGILNLYANPIDGMTVIQTITSISEANPVFALVESFMKANVHPEMLTNFAHPVIRASLILSAENGGLGLTQELANPILRAAEIPQTITAIEVEYVRTRM